MIVLLCMWEFIEQWPCCESIPSLGLIKWIFQRVITDAWLVGARSCLPDVLQKEKHFSPQSPTQRSIVVWWAPELMRIPGKSHLCLAGSLIANCPWTGFHQSCPVLTAAFPSVYELSCFCMFLYVPLLKHAAIFETLPRKKAASDRRCYQGVQQPGDCGSSWAPQQPLWGWWYHAAHWSRSA